MARKNHLSIHYLRIMACLMVILIHISATPVVSLNANSVAQVFFILINQFAKPAVPIFIMISGFLLHGIYKDTELAPIAYWTKRLPKLVIPYVLWSLGYYFIYLKMGYYPWNLKFILNGLLLGTFIYHLYFMVIIIQFYLLYPILHFIYKRIGMIALFIAILSIQFLVIKVPFEYRDRLFVTYFCYFGLGMLLSIYLPKLMKVWKIQYLGIIGFITAGTLNSWLVLNSQNTWLELPEFVHIFSYTFLSLLCGLSLFIFFEGLTLTSNVKQSRQIKIGKLSNATQLIYFAHPLFILFSEFIMNQLGVISISLRALSAFTTIMVLLVPIAYYIKNNIAQPKI